MTDQEKLPQQRTLVQDPNRSNVTSGTVIETFTNGSGESIENGGVSTNPDLSIVGSAAPNQKAQLFDNGVPKHFPVNVDHNRHFSLIIKDQVNGPHSYTVETTDGQVSDPYIVHMVLRPHAAILWINDPDGGVIEDGGSTTFVDMSFVGEGEANTTVSLLDNGILVATLNIDANAHWSALLNGLSVGVHHFTVVGSDGVESRPWIVVIVNSVTPTIQFLWGESGQLIHNHEQTTDTSLTVVGTANPGEKGKVVDYEKDLSSFTADSNGIYTAKISNLAEKVHTIRTITAGGGISSPWAFRVVPAKAR
ncbi:MULTISPECIES: hypothetical protein [Pseudomonas]|uniref:Uncharacterized protein n=1 Tax=Pseudomonas glycinae TaxID=1785145 RepID=A0ABM5ZFW2_9PSED|nr:MULTISPECIES: hypothetical protein [Pseudomonas]AMQ82557.1 hypothetical protein AWU82_04445 [Pseudomonas glycinae]NKF29125.1 hypothetical protein [Pseudomonas sp. BG5]